MVRRPSGCRSAAPTTTAAAPSRAAARSGSSRASATVPSPADREVGAGRVGGQRRQVVRGQEQLRQHHHPRALGDAATGEAGGGACVAGDVTGHGVGLDRGHGQRRGGDGIGGGDGWAGGDGGAGVPGGAGGVTG